MEPEYVRARAIVRGRVQGVWFRQSTVEALRDTGVRGWVRNRDDGTVEAVFEGTAPIVEHALDYVRVGPPHARVDAVEVAWEPAAGETGFGVR